jgi:hypothetical protein
MGASGGSELEAEFQRGFVAECALLVGEREIGIQQIQVEARAASVFEGRVLRIHGSKKCSGTIVQTKDNFARDERCRKRWARTCATRDIRMSRSLLLNRRPGRMNVTRRAWP